MKWMYQFFLVSILVLAGGLAQADHPEQKAAAGQAPDAAMMEQMKQMKVLSSPSEAHKVLENFAGKWTYTAEFWMAPGTPAEKSAGTADHALIYGGRFLDQKFKGEWMGEPFEGNGLTGYDNIKKEYVSTWYDNMSTGIMAVSGQYDAATKTLGMQGTHSCAMTGDAEKVYRSEWKIVDSNSNVYTAYSLGPDGQEFKGMEISYKRA